LRQSVYSRIAGYEDVNDAERLSQDPTFRLIGSENIWERGAALTSRLQSFETDLLTQEGNLDGLAAINRDLIAKAEAIDSPAAGSAGHRQYRDPRVRPTGAERLQRAFRVHLLSPAAAVQSGRRLLGGETATPATCTAPATGKKFSYPRSTASRSTRTKWWYEPTQPLLSRRSTRRWKSGA
jgi:hypothetical protein